MKKILIDGRFVGIGESMTRYTLEILRGILKLDRENQYTLLIRPCGRKSLDDYFAVIPAEAGIQGMDPRIKSEDDNRGKLIIQQYNNLTIELLDIPHYSINEQLKLLKYLNRKNFDLVHFIQFNHPIRYKGSFVVTVHDMTMVGYLRRANPIRRIAFTKVMESAVANSKKIITVSNTAKKEIVDFYKINPEKVEVVYNGLNHESYNSRVREKSTEIKKVLEKFNIDKEYILYTGMWKEHKNILRLVYAFEKFSEMRLPDPKSRIIKLVLAGKADKDEKEILTELGRINQSLNMKYNVREAIITPGYIEESELPLLYSGATAYVFASLSEGFGMPPLESMACGTPVIASEVSAMPEVLGEAAIYFDPLDSTNIAEAMEEVTENKNERVEIIKKGYDQVKKYDWSKTAEETLKVYKDILK